MCVYKSMNTWGHCLLLILETRSLAEPRVRLVTSKTSQSSCLSSLTPARGLELPGWPHPDFYVGSRDLNLGPYAFTASVLTHWVISPAPSLIFLETRSYSGAWWAARELIAVLWPQSAVCWDHRCGPPYLNKRNNSKMDGKPDTEIATLKSTFSLQSPLPASQTPLGTQECSCCIRGRSEQKIYWAVL